MPDSPGVNRENKNYSLKAFQLAGQTKETQTISKQALTNFTGADVRAERVPRRTGKLESVKVIGKTANYTYFQIII